MTDHAGLERLLTEAEVADLLRVSPRTVRRLIRSGALLGVRVGRFWRIRPSDLLAYQERGQPAVLDIEDAKPHGLEDPLA